LDFDAVTSTRVVIALVRFAWIGKDGAELALGFTITIVVILVGAFIFFASVMFASLKE
jgi:hypothetical protein